MAKLHSSKNDLEKSGKGRGWRGKREKRLFQIVDARDDGDERVVVCRHFANVDAGSGRSSEAEKVFDALVLGGRFVLYSQILPDAHGRRGGGSWSKKKGGKRGKKEGKSLRWQG